jgi:acyl carrier protein
MSFEHWQAALRPKVQGSWNLHTVLPENMDFFVMLSSVAGIFGNRGQANYAAGNTFQDALAAYRVSKGMKGSSLNLGSVSNVGWVAENRSSMRTHTATLFESLREDEVHAAVEFLIDPRQRKDPGNGTESSQLVLGLPTAEMCRQNGVATPTYLDYSMFTHFRNSTTTTSSEPSEQNAISTAALLATISNLEDAAAVVSNGIVERLSSLLAIPPSEFDARRFGFGGIDSLVAMEFRSWIIKELKAEISLLDIMGAENIKALSEKIASRSRLVSDCGSASL